MDGETIPEKHIPKISTNSSVRILGVFARERNRCLSPPITTEAFPEPNTPNIWDTASIDSAVKQDGIAAVSLVLASPVEPGLDRLRRVAPQLLS
jgi:hypothetical protein